MLPHDGSGKPSADPYERKNSTFATTMAACVAARDGIREESDQVFYALTRRDRKEEVDAIQALYTILSRAVANPCSRKTHERPQGLVSELAKPLEPKWQRKY